MEGKELKEEVKNIKKETIEEVLLLFYYLYQNYLKCAFKFGFSNTITKKIKKYLKSLWTL